MTVEQFMRPNGSARQRTESAGLRLTMFGDIDHSPKKDWLVANFLGAGELSCIFGAPGSAKSVVAGDISCHVAASRDWCGRRVTGAGVLFVAAERAGLVKRRFAAWRQHHGLDGLALGIIDGSVDLRSSPASAQVIIDMAKRLADAKQVEVGLIELDTVSRCVAGGDENSPKDMGLFIRNVERLLETGAHVQMVHHIPADGTQRLRGWGGVLAACDTTFRIEQTADVRTMILDKGNDVEEGQRASFTLKSVALSHDDETGLTTTAPVVIPAEVPAKAEVERGPKLTANQKTMLSLLADAGPQGLSVNDWNDKARAEGIGVTRRATPGDIRRDLKEKKLVHEYADVWHVSNH